MVGGNRHSPHFASLILALAVVTFGNVALALAQTSENDERPTSAHFKLPSDKPQGDSGGMAQAAQENPKQQKPGPSTGTPGATGSQKPGRPAGTPGLRGESEPPSFEVSGAYTYLRLAGANCHGGSGSIAYNVNDSVGAVAEVGGCRDTGLPSGITGHAVTYLFGPRINFRSSSKFTPYGQLLVGGAHFGGTGGASANAFAMTIGGGLDLRISDHVSFRVAQAEYLLTRFGGTQQNNFRFESGIVLRLGSK